MYHKVKEISFRKRRSEAIKSFQNDEGYVPFYRLCREAKLKKDELLSLYEKSNQEFFYNDKDGNLQFIPEVLEKILKNKKEG